MSKELGSNGDGAVGSGVMKCAVSERRTALGGKSQELGNRGKVKGYFGFLTPWFRTS